MKMPMKRRSVLKGMLASGASMAVLKAPAVHAQAAPFKLGLLTVKTGPLAQGGIQMEQGVLTYLKQTNNMMAGRKVEFFSADTGGNPAGTKTKVQELVERDKVDTILGPLAAFELLAITDYIAQSKIPLISLAGAEDMTQRRPNPYFVRTSATSGQFMHPMADYAFKEMKLKRIACISEDFAFGYEQMGGFQAAFAQDGGCIVSKLWPPLVTPDYTPYIAQLADCDGVCQGFAGSNPLRFMKQYSAAGLKYPVVTGETGGDDALLKSYGEEAIGLVSCCPYTLDLPIDANQRFVDGMLKSYDTVPGQYAALLYVNCQVVDAALKALNGDATDKDKLMNALRGVSLTETPRGALKFDHLGNVIGTFYIRRIGTEGAKYGLKVWNKTIKTYDNVSQFWDWPEQEFLAHPVYSRDYPPLTKC
jgi:branched-chain amino acid transport system substrate-binding protein